jgi:hypothetical protein
VLLFCHVTHAFSFERSLHARAGKTGGIRKQNAKFQRHSNYAFSRSFYSGELMFAVSTDLNSFIHNPLCSIVVHMALNQRVAEPRCETSHPDRLAMVPFSLFRRITGLCFIKGNNSNASPVFSSKHFPEGFT